MENKEIKFILLTSGNSTITGATALTSATVEEAIAGKYATGTQLPIVFIEDKQKIYLDGEFYGTSNADIKDIQNKLSNHETRIVANATAIDNILSPAIEALQSAVGATSDTASSDGSIYARITKLVSDLNNEVATRENAVSTLESNVRAFTVNGEAFGASGAITIDASDIKIGSNLPDPSITNVTNTSTITYALSQLKQDILEVASGIAAGSSSSADAAAQAMAEARKHTQVNAGTGITVIYTPSTNNVGNIYTVSVTDNIATKTYVDNKAQAEATAAYTQAVTNLTGATSDAVTAITIYGARNYAKDLTDKLSAALTGLSTAHLELIEQIKREIENPDGASGIIETFLDKLLTVGAGFNGIDGGTTGVTGTIKNYIDSNVTALSTAIANAQNNANSSIKSVNGLTGDTNGAVIVGATDVLMTNYTAATGAVASTDSVLTAIAKVEQHSIDGVNAAATAQASANVAINNAATAQTTADKAINLLSWVII